MSLVSKLLFPAPVPTYSAYSFPSELLWIPSDLNYRSCKPHDCAPAVLLRSPAARYLLVFFHSNGEDLGMCHGFCNKLRCLLEVHVLMVEYPGYGICPGECSEASMMSACSAAFRFACEVLHWPKGDIILMGRSLGAAVAIQLAASYDCQGLILVAPFLSVLDIFERYLGVFAHAIVDDVFASNEHIQKVRVPTLVIHGQKDTLVPCSQGQKLYELCRQRKQFVCPETMDHNSDILANADYFIRPMLGFFALPDYSFKNMVVPASAFDKRLCTSYRRKHVPGEDGERPKLPRGDDRPCEASFADEALGAFMQLGIGPHGLRKLAAPTGDEDDLDGAGDLTVRTGIGGAGLEDAAVAMLDLDVGISRYLREVREAK